MDKPVLYQVEPSPSVRSVRLVAAAIGVELELRFLDLFNSEHLKEPFISMNPQHTVPTLDDNGKVIWDSHAIACYLINAYAKDDSLYPKDPYKRARVDQRLHFNNSVLFARYRDCNMIFYSGGFEVPQEKISALYEAYDILEAFLKGDPYLVGDSLSIADLCSIPTVTSMDYHAPIDAKKYPKITEWIARVTELPYYDELSGQYVEQLIEYLNGKKKANREQTNDK